jgi:hypothetical protein
MKIDGINSPDANQRKASSASKGGDVSFAAELAAAKAGEVASTPSAKTPRADFTSMTGKQLFDWASSKAKTGDISPDDSFSLQSMAVVVQPGKSIAVDDKAKVDFTQQAQAGLEWAKSNGETDLASMMEANLKVMKKYQVS